MAAFGQTIVSTQSENKKVIMEEFTGINCVYCPQGHAIAKQIQDSSPGNVFLINVHQGGFATPSGSQPDFRTPFGNAIVNQSYSGSGFGYPSGTVNRHNFPGMEMTAAGTTAMGRDKWVTAANQTLTQSSYVNTAVQATVDASTRVMTINVEVYYTGNSPIGTNKLNVVLLQNNTTGPQVGGGMGNNYVHMHRLIDMITGQWGEDITTTTAGSFVSKTYTYTIPESFNNIPAVLGELELVVFIAEGNQEIISGNGTFPSYNNLEFNNEIAVNSIIQIDPQCSGEVSPKIEIKNNGNDILTSLDINYSINGGASQTFTWTGELGGLQKEWIELPNISYSDQVNELTVVIPSDEMNDNNSNMITFEKAPVGTLNLALEIRTDNWGSETTWEILSSSGEVVESGSGYGNNQTYNIDLALDLDCYTFRLLDEFGDGGARATLKDANDQTLFNITGASYSTSASRNFSTGELMGVGDLSLNNTQIYPNPSNGIFNIALGKSAKIEVYDMTGRRIYVTNGSTGVNTVNLNGKGTGIFVVKIIEESSVITKKVVIK